MAHTDVDSKLDLDAVCAAQRADPEMFSAAEFARAERFYRQRRQHDEVLLAVRARAISLIREWTGRESRDVGSFGLRLNLASSDLDLGIGYPVEQRGALMTALAAHVSFKGRTGHPLSGRWMLGWGFRQDHAAGLCLHRGRRGPRSERANGGRFYRRVPDAR